jgi:DNA-binding transcriptional MerR regulator
MVRTLLCEAESTLSETLPRCGHNSLDRQSASSPAEESDSRLYSIRDMAREFQLSIRALRLYEDRGLLHPRREGNVRRYDARDRLHLRMILKGKRLGFTLTEIRDILAGHEGEAGKPDLEMGLSLEQIAAQIAYLEHQRGQIDEAIATLREAQRRLLEFPEQEVGHCNRTAG